MKTRQSIVGLLLLLVLPASAVWGQEGDRRGVGLKLFLQWIGRTFEQREDAPPTARQPEQAQREKAPSTVRQPEQAQREKAPSTVRQPEQAKRELHQFLAVKCAACHSGPHLVRPGFDVTQPAILDKAGVLEYGSADNSLVWRRVARGEMPPPRVRHLATSERQQLKRLIDDAGQPTLSGKPSIMEYAESDPRLQAFVTWAKRAQVDVELQRDGNYTIFAPLNDAIVQLGKPNEAHLLANPSELRSVVLNHGVAEGRYDSTQLKKMGQIWTLMTQHAIREDRWGLRIDDAIIIQPDILCSNGVIHIIDKVLVPPTVAEKLPVPIDNTYWAPFSVEMVVIPGGAFLMGAPPDEPGRSPNDGPQHQVQLSPYRIARCEITRLQYTAALKKDPADKNMPGNRQQPNDDPVQNITWYEAIQFCNAMSELDGLPLYYLLRKPRQLANKKWEYDVTVPDPKSASYRLPTEAECEYAARAGNPGMYCFGSDRQQLGQYAWYDENAIDQKTSPVGQLLPNAYGLFDMHGNVSEWCHDWYEPNYTAPSGVVDPLGPIQGERRVVRGGSYFWTWKECRSAARFEQRSHTPTYFHRSLGFRVARYQPPERPREFANAGQE